MANKFDVWMEFCESLRPELDSICFYPESMLPFSKLSLLGMLGEIYRSYKNEPDSLRQQESIAVNVGYLGRFTSSVSEKYITRQGYLLLQMQTLDTSNPSAIVNMMNSAPDANDSKDIELLLEFSNTLMYFCQLTGFSLNKLIDWNGFIGAESAKAVQSYYEITKK